MNGTPEQWRGALKNNPCDCSSIRSHVNTPPLHWHWSKTEETKKWKAKTFLCIGGGGFRYFSRFFHPTLTHPVAGLAGIGKSHRAPLDCRSAASSDPLDLLLLIPFYIPCTCHCCAGFAVVCERTNKKLYARCKRKKSSRSEGKTPHHNLSLPLSSLLAAAAFFFASCKKWAGGGLADRAV